MPKVLITGATGNVGLAVIKALYPLPPGFTIYAGLRDVAADNALLTGYDLHSVAFDFTDSSTYQPALSRCDVLFLLRPPQISDVETYFKPLIAEAKQQGVSHIIFLSVQGVERSSIIPHHKIEKLIAGSGVPYTFLRPAYFMQNFTTTLRRDLVARREIFLPAGQAKFTLVDVADVGKVAAAVIHSPAAYRNQAFDLTSSDRLSFQEMADQLSAGLGTRISYRSPNLLRFFIQKRRERVPAMFILVMIMLHYLPRFQTPPPIADWITRITGTPAKDFKQFIAEHKAELLA